jgi:hypothetical protein
MDEATLNQIRTLIKEAKEKIPALEQELARAKAAGLADYVRVAEDTLQKTKDQLAQLEKAYGR